MKTTYFSTTTVAAVLTAGLSVSPLLSSTAQAQLPSKPTPQGMRSIATGGSGRILTTHLRGTTSARKMLTALKYLSNNYFDGPFTVTRAYIDGDDQNLQASFIARIKGVPVHGIAAVTSAGEGGDGTLLFDNAKTFSRSLQTLIARQNGGGGGRKASMPAVSLTRHTAPDGSCQISLPAGYNIVGAYKGTLDIVGPHGASMSLGAPVVCTRPEAAAYFPAMPALDFNDPVRATVAYMQWFGRKQGKQVGIKVLDVKPTSLGMAGHAAFIRYTMRIEGKNYEAFGLFSISQTDVNQGFFYDSYICAPESTYKQQFPGMLRAWGTWSISQSVFTERLMAAAQTMRGMSDIITSSYDNQQKTNARVFEGWSDVTRDQWTWKNPDTGDRYKLPNTYTNLGTPTQNGVELEQVPLNEL